MLAGPGDSGCRKGLGMGEGWPSATPYSSQECWRGTARLQAPAAARPPLLPAPPPPRRQALAHPPGPKGVLTQGGSRRAASERGSLPWRQHSGQAGRPCLWPRWGPHRHDAAASSPPQGGRSGQPDAELWHQNCLCPVGREPVRVPRPAAPDHSQLPAVGAQANAQQRLFLRLSPRTVPPRACRHMTRRCPGPAGVQGLVSGPRGRSPALSHSQGHRDTGTRAWEWPG